MDNVMERSTSEVLDRGMRCLMSQLDIIEVERFLTIVCRERLDYTTWSKTAFDDMSLEEFNAAAAAYDREHPFKPKREQIPI